MSTKMLFFFNDTATTEIYTLSLHDALPIWRLGPWSAHRRAAPARPRRAARRWPGAAPSRRRAGTGSGRSEEHTSELQSRQYLVCRLLLEKKNLGHSNTFVSSFQFFWVISLP